MNWNKNNNDNNPWGSGGNSPWGGNSSNNKDFEDSIKKARENLGSLNLAHLKIFFLLS